MTNVRRYGPVLAIAALAVGALAVFEPSVLTSTVRSPRAIGTLITLAVATSVAGRIVTRRWGRGAGRLTSVVAIGLAVWLLVMPALRQTTLDEAFPVASATGSTTTTIHEATATPPTSTPETDESRQLTTGRLEGIDHEASGTVSVFRLADGSSVIRFEEVDIRGAPDPVLYLVPGADRQTRDGGLRVDNLKATKGSFNHTVPAPFDFEQPFTVFIWCDRFAVPIANADQQRA